MSFESKNNIKRDIGIALLIFMLCFFVYIGSKSTSNNNSVTTTPTLAPTAAPTKKEIAMKNVKIDAVGTKSGFGTILMLKIKLENPNDFEVKDIQVTCHTYGASGTRIDSAERTIYEVVPPKSTKTAPEVNFGFVSEQMKTFKCYVTNLQA